MRIRIADTMRLCLLNKAGHRILQNVLLRQNATFMALLLCIPELAFAQASYGTATGLLQALVQAIFISWGPYIFMVVLGVSVLMVGKGWVPMKGAAIAVASCFCFFCVPSIVRYLAAQAAAQI
jgi:uncharacterized protein (DUF486 family)